MARALFIVLEGPGTSFPSLALRQLNARNVCHCHTMHKYLTIFNFETIYDSKEISISAAFIM